MQCISSHWHEAQFHPIEGISSNQVHIIPTRTSPPSFYPIKRIPSHPALCVFLLIVVRLILSLRISSRDISALYSTMYLILSLILAPKSRVQGDRVLVLKIG